MNNRLDWVNKTFTQTNCSGTMTANQSGDILISGTVQSNTPNPMIMYWAANSPDYGTSFSGSGLPFPNPEIAYNQTNNSGQVQADNKTFSFKIKYPNAYYVGLGTLYVPPHVNIKVVEPGSPDKYITIQIDEGIPFRTLTYPSPPSKNPRISPMFYSLHAEEVRTQEQILRDGAYPAVNKMPDNFWGLKPPR